MIVVDTSVWSQALRRPRRGDALPGPGKLLMRLIREGEPIVLPGIVYQELLSGLRHQPQFLRLRRVLAPFPVLLATRDDHLQAASIVNTCRASGVQVSAVDALIVSMAAAREATLLTSDRDYVHMAEHVNVDLNFVLDDSDAS